MSAYPEPNQHGVYLREICEELTLPGVGTAKRARGIALAHVLVVQVGPTAWLEGFDYQCRHGQLDGRGRLPCARGHSHGTRAEAIAAGAAGLLEGAKLMLSDRAADVERGPRMGRRYPSVSADQVREARALEAWASQLLDGVQGQTELFAEAAR